MGWQAYKKSTSPKKVKDKEAPNHLYDDYVIFKQQGMTSPQILELLINNRSNTVNNHIIREMNNCGYNVPKNQKRDYIIGKLVEYHEARYENKEVATKEIVAEADEESEADEEESEDNEEDDDDDSFKSDEESQLEKFEKDSKTMSKKELKTYCDENEILYNKSDTKEVLITTIKNYLSS